MNNDSSEVRVSSLHIYPIKSAGSIDLMQSEVLPTGLQYDRNWMLVDSKGLFITQRSHPSMARVGVEINKEKLSVFEKGRRSTEASMSLSDMTLLEIQTNVWDTKVKANVASLNVSHWFTEFLGEEVYLVTNGESFKRSKFADEISSDIDLQFSDGYPILVANEASLEDLNERLDSPVPMNRFRANVVLSGLAPFQEDDVKKLVGDKVNIDLLNGCKRCTVITQDQDSGLGSKEPLSTLATFRKEKNNIYFGINAVSLKGGIIKVGDRLQLSN